LEWISQNWGSYPTKPKIAFIGLSGVSFYISQEATVKEWMAAHPDQFEWLGSQLVPSTVTSWALEIKKFEKADFIFASMSGPPLVSLVKEARARGYTKRFIGPSETFFSFYMLMRAGVSPADLNNLIAGTYTPWWNDSNSFMDEVETYAEKYHSADQLTAIHQGTGQFNGWAAGMIFVDAVKRAVKKVGVDKLDGLAIHEALKDTDMTVPGWGNPWKLVEGENYFAQTVRLVEYKSDVDNWVGITDFVYPPSMR
jgi:ABC-type branched-subunit amino acid transport system substrate-binding protein